MDRDLDQRVTALEKIIERARELAQRDPVARMVLRKLGLLE